MSLRPNSTAYTVILAGISALPPLSIDMNLPAIPDIESSFGVAQGQGSLTLSLFLLGFSLAPILGGPVSDSCGRRRTLIAALALNTLAAFGCMLGVSFQFLLASRLLQGVACGVCVLVPLAILRDVFAGAEARKKLSAIMFVGGVAPLVAPILGGAVLLFSGWRMIYAVQCCMGLALLCLVAMGVAETLPPEKRNGVNPGAILRNYRAIFSSPRFLGLALGQAFCFGCMFSYISGSPAYMLGELHLSEQQYSLMFACTSCGVMAGATVSGVLGRWEVPSRRVIAGGMTVMTVTTLAIFALVWSGVTGGVFLVPLLFVVMGCFGLLLPNVMSEAVAPWGHMAGAASGAINSLQMVVGALASALVPLLAASLAPSKAMATAMLCAALLATLLALLFGRRAAAGAGAGTEPPRG